MSFPITKRYRFNGLVSDTGLTPAWVFFKGAISGNPLTQPSIVELSNGAYYFDYTWNSAADEDIVGLINMAAPAALDDAGAKWVDISVSEVVSLDSSSALTRALGMLHENSVLDQTSFDANNMMLAARLRIYDSKANAQAAGATGVIASYAIVATYTGTDLSTYTVTRES